MNANLFKRIFRLLSRQKYRMFKFWKSLAPSGVFVDVGASYFFNQNWYLATHLPTSTLVQIEPNEQNLNYLQEQEISAQVIAIPKALSKDGGMRTLYVTNVDSGSTMFEPWISPDFEPRLSKDIFSYFYPIKEVEVETSRLVDVLPEYLFETPLVLKLDVQGSEHEILRGSSELLERELVVAIEVEASLLREPFAKGGTKFSELKIFLETFGFELVSMKLIHSHGANKPRDFEQSGFLNECDALFVLNHRALMQKPIEYRLCGFFTLCMYGQIRDALMLLDSDEELKKLVSKVTPERKNLKKLLKLHESFSW